MDRMLEETAGVVAGRTAIEVVPTGGPLGADIVGLSFADPAPEDIALVRQAWLRYGVLRFRGYDFGDEEHLRFTAHFGDFVLHPRQLVGEEGAHPVHERILVIANAKKDGKIIGTMGNAEARWHSDTYIKERPPAAALLHALKIPSTGGNTYFCNMYAVYDDLPRWLKRILEGRFIQLDLVYDGPGRVRKGMTVPDHEDYRRWPAIRHPIIRTHGESGRNCLYLGGYSKRSWIVGLPFDESREILDDLWERVARPQYHWTQVWQLGDLLMWDNRCTMHRRDGWNADDERIMHRTTTEGERPFYAC